jgi:hypothetical protein
LRYSDSIFFEGFFTYKNCSTRINFGDQDEYYLNGHPDMESRCAEGIHAGGGTRVARQSVVILPALVQTTGAGSGILA